jgi:UDP-N-acetylglucosamine:LPS N-acetylglucosamine transferase
MATIVMAGGGTGGHVMPLLAVARELRSVAISPSSSGTRTGFEAKLVPAGRFSARIHRDRRIESRRRGAHSLRTRAASVQRLRVLSN